MVLRLDWIPLTSLLASLLSSSSFPARAVSGVGFQVVLQTVMGHLEAAASEAYYSEYKWTWWLIFDDRLLLCLDSMSDGAFESRRVEMGLCDLEVIAAADALLLLTSACVWAQILFHCVVAKFENSPYALADDSCPLSKETHPEVAAPRILAPLSKVASPSEGTYFDFVFVALEVAIDTFEVGEAATLPSPSQIALAHSDPHPGLSISQTPAEVLWNSRSPPRFRHSYLDAATSLSCDMLF